MLSSSPLASPLASPLVGAIPVVDLDGTFFVQGGIFLLLMLVLGPLLFRPWLEVRERRDQQIGGALEAAAKLRERALSEQANYTKGLAAAREAALDARGEARRETDSEGTLLVDTARAEAASALARDRARIADEVRSARDALSARIDALATEIGTKILGRSI